jgi:hypothetical protein
MKIAFCLFGIVGGAHKYGNGDPIDFVKCCNSYKEKIFKDNDVDVFIHTWSTTHEKPIRRIYNPKSSIFEKQINFNDNKVKDPITRKDKFVECSRWNSTQKVIDLQREYSEKNNIEYDFIMLSRFDMLWFSKIDFEKLEKNKLYLSNWNNYGYQIGDKIDKENNSYPYGQRLRLYQDLWIIGNQEQMNHISKLYDLIEKSESTKYSPHGILFKHLYSKYGSIIEFKYYYGIDYNLYRRAILKNWM